MADMLWTIWRRKKEYQIAQVDVFSGQAFIWAYLCGWLLIKLDKPIILTLHGGNLPEFADRHSNHVRWLLFQANSVTAPSRYLLEKMSSYRDDILLIPNALDTVQYSYIPRVSPRPVVIWLRAFHEIYHPEMAIRVLKILRNDFQEVKLIMVGPDKSDGSLERTRELAAHLDLEHAVEFSGGVLKPEVPTWLNKGDIFINTTNIDNTPVSVMEAMACGLCVVSTNVGGISYMLEDGVDALLVRCNDPEAMAAAVRRILTEPGLAARLSANARKKAERYDWSVVLPQWEALINELIEHESR